jgi:hypothetical protein
LGPALHAALSSKKTDRTFRPFFYHGQQSVVKASQQPGCPVRISLHDRYGGEATAFLDFAKNQAGQQRTVAETTQI